MQRCHSFTVNRLVQDPMRGPAVAVRSVCNVCFRASRPVSGIHVSTRSSWRRHVSSAASNSTRSSTFDDNDSSATSSDPSPSAISSRSPSHHNLTTFLAHAARTNVSTTSTVYTGTLYEYQCQAALAQLGFTLSRCGGRSDAGVDLYGTWRIPSHAQPLRCIVQCKALAGRVGPNLVRELEGAFTGAPDGWQDEDAIGVLCATREASKGVRDAIRDSARGLVWVMVERTGSVGAGVTEQPGESDRTAVPAVPAQRIAQIVWNERVAEIGAQGLGVGVVYSGSAEPDVAHHSKVRGEVRLMWDGRIWKPETGARSGQELVQ